MYQGNDIALIKAKAIAPKRTFAFNLDCTIRDNPQKLPSYLDIAQRESSFQFPSRSLSW